jgi:hypothetical protein
MHFGHWVAERAMQAPLLVSVTSAIGPAEVPEQMDLDSWVDVVMRLPNNGSRLE